MKPRPTSSPLLAAVLATLVAPSAAYGGGTTPTTMPDFTSGWGAVRGFSIELAGRDLNGTSLNGDPLDGHAVEGVFYSGAELDGHLMQDVWLDGSELRGIGWNGRKKRNDDFAGSFFDAEIDDGSIVTLYISSVQRGPTKADKDVWGYEVWYPNADDWQPLCGLDDNGVPLRAIPLNGRWNHEEGTADGGSWIDTSDSFTFACDNYVLAKCVFAGYKPWQRAAWCTPGDGCVKTNLSRHHQACTRALRADYFGDGTPHTHDGTLISMYDLFGVRSDDDPWTVEAAWDVDGAICLGQSRLDDPTTPPFGGPCTGFGSGGLLVTEVPPR